MSKGSIRFYVLFRHFQALVASETRRTELVATVETRKKGHGGGGVSFPGKISHKEILWCLIVWPHYVTGKAIVYSNRAQKNLGSRPDRDGECKASKYADR